MADRVDAGGGGDLVRHGGGEVGVEGGDAGGGLFVPAGHFIVRYRIGGERGGLGLAAGAGGVGDGDEREQGLGGFVDAPVVFDVTAVGEEEVDALGAVHRTAATQADDEIDLKFFGDGESAGDVLGGGIFADAVIEAGGGNNPGEGGGGGAPQTGPPRAGGGGGGGGGGA